MQFDRFGAQNYHVFITPGVPVRFRSSLSSSRCRLSPFQHPQFHLLACDSRRQSTRDCSRWPLTLSIRPPCADRQVTPLSPFGQEGFKIARQFRPGE